jgi:hypothetical protein
MIVRSDGTNQIKQRSWFGTLLYLTQRGPVHLTKKAPAYGKLGPQGMHIRT